MASIQLATLLMLTAVAEWVLATSGEHAKASTNVVEEIRSADIDPSPVELLRRVKRANPRDRRMLLQHSASGYHDDRHHGRQQRRGTAHPLQTALAQHLLVRRKGIRRDETTPTVTGMQAPALQQALAFHPSAAHRLPAAEFLRDESKPKPAERTGKTRRRKLARRRGRRGHPLTSNPIGLEPHRERYRGRARDREPTKPVRGGPDGGNETSTVAHHYKQKARDQRPRYRVYRPGSRKAAFSSPPVERRTSADGPPDSVADKLRVHPVTVHRVGVAPPRRRAPVSGFDERRRRLPAAQVSAAGGLRHGAGGGVASSSMMHAIPAPHRHHVGQRIHASDGRKKKSSVGRSKRSRGTKRPGRSSRRTLRRVSQHAPLTTSSQRHL